MEGGNQSQNQNVAFFPVHKRHRQRKVVDKDRGEGVEGYTVGERSAM